jgi:2-polyprenyl-3-methyl-5-hydroxy-6-metoxy-1,4-benzoquinol methylase
MDRPQISVNPVRPPRLDRGLEPTMTDSPDLFADKAQDWDARPLPVQISSGVFAALTDAVALTSDLAVLDFGAGTGLVATQVASRVGSVLAVDVSAAMLEQLAAKQVDGDLRIRCQDILEAPLGETVDLVVSAMALHHVEDTRALFAALFDHLVPGGKVALADLDAEDGDFHPPGIEGVFHHGFDRADLAAVATSAGFVEPRFVTATEVRREDKSYPIFLMTAVRPG